MYLDTIKKIIILEWSFFNDVQALGGRAGCQDNPWTFALMRASQFAAWSDDLLHSYYCDLEQCASSGRNPVTEKYAYMMEEDDPVYFKQIQHLLPGIHPKKKILVNILVQSITRWQEDMQRNYPLLLNQGRALSRQTNMRQTVFQEGTSFITYLRAELLTYSLQTLEKYQHFLTILEDEGFNLCQMILENTVRFYGFQSISAAQNSLPQNKTL